MYAEVTGTDHIVMLHSIAGMSVKETESSLRLFSSEVLPVVRSGRRSVSSTRAEDGGAGIPACRIADDTVR